MNEEMKKKLEQVDLEGAIAMAEHLGVSLETVLEVYCGIEL